MHILNKNYQDINTISIKGLKYSPAQVLNIIQRAQIYTNHYYGLYSVIAKQFLFIVLHKWSVHYYLCCTKLIFHHKTINNDILSGKEFL